MSSASGERMDAIYRYQRHVYDITRRHFLLGRDTLIAGLCPPKEGSVLEIGCGTARNLILASQHYPDALLYGIDVSATMLATARASLLRHGLEQRIALKQADATDCDLRTLLLTDGFDRIYFSYVLSMIPAWPVALERAADGLKPGGAIHIVDFGDMSGMPRFAARSLRAWLRRFDVTPHDDLRACLQALADRRGRSLYFAPMLRDYAVYAVLR